MSVTSVPRSTRLIVADLDGTLLHDAPTFEERFLSQRSVDALVKAHEQGLKFAISTARPVSTGLHFAQRLPVDACVYLNGALIDTDPARSDFSTLTSGEVLSDGHLQRIGFSSQRACETCLMLLDAMPGLQLGIVMNDVRYTNFDVSVLWKTQEYRITDFTDVPKGQADKIFVMPQPEQCAQLASLIPPDFKVSISEGTMWMLMNPLANKESSLRTVCERLGIGLGETASFGDDLIDIDMLKSSGTGVAVANANPRVLGIADEVCPANNEDGVAQWVEQLIA
ncbi:MULTISPECIES: HAD family hydrolase [Bifidobacterium]|jgi:Cof subfamily protein (haloacid dehalogenase superfamily)|uniref:HAD family hydrolase n=1 Tax=Bifidobacterium tibiigranuli TaxID=2172043 RepID=A0A5N6S7K1_9BIFI|nr:HAD family hydrolase [Bifidobacterium tibiigranuli]KAE8130050.1 HAD family hydrolase [Bifidobacterium tibiigranuli]KAE8130592.1 HAD family hydrolase [Bifidobacterium tibiigranuli]MCH3974547.1 HAD family hydrolase [Bifidobacterium tibiigranuli]MCH4189465.1 HAD family hydrolase [Bifidobacterium tibiigranuli]MCH4204288.1 HAD family hydrolase [Bifidobacterium tibiigranuli]